jgi:hypothetical protein
MLDLDGVRERGRDVLRGEHVAHGAGGDHPPVRYQQRVAGRGRQLPEMVCDEDRRDAGAGGAEQVDRLQELLARGDVEAGRRLVQEQEPRVADQGAGDERPAALTAGQGGPARVRPGRQAQGGDQAVGAGEVTGRRWPAQRELGRPGDAGEDDLADGQGGRGSCRGFTGPMERRRAWSSRRRGP